MKDAILSIRQGAAFLGMTYLESEFREESFLDEILEGGAM